MGQPFQTTFHGVTAMKITKVIPWLIEAPRPFLDTADDNKNATSVREYLFIEVSTDEGVTGVGERSPPKKLAPAPSAPDYGM